jgi:hypothetical protein
VIIDTTTSPAIQNTAPNEKATRKLRKVAGNRLKISAADIPG